LLQHRAQESEYTLAKIVMQTHLQDGDADVMWWLFPQALRITRQWIKECVTYKDNTYPQFLLIDEIARKAAHRIHNAILEAERQAQTSESGNGPSPKVFLPIFRDKTHVAPTEGVEVATTQPTWETDPEKCHLSHVVADTDSWEQKTAQALEQMDEVIAYVKNHNLDFTIPYINHNGESRHYVPDFITRIRKPDSADDNIVNLILEVSGRAREDKVQKVNTVQNMWVPAVNRCGEFGKWTYREITDPWNIESTIRECLDKYD